ncbi:uncharacterized protein LOC143252324 [Tachypleus tridentatus]|uniref:uncharacterized protein LOC143252324 n=1 Tax=Tachypleus tridentatus TaxID=6853 RepID=UPI003FCF5A2D
MIWIRLAVLIVFGLSFSSGFFNLFRFCVNFTQTTGLVTQQCTLCSSLTFTNTVLSCLGTTVLPTNVTTAQGQCLINGCALRFGRSVNNPPKESVDQDAGSLTATNEGSQGAWQFVDEKMYQHSDQSGTGGMPERWVDATNEEDFLEEGVEVDTS